jgi:hypothetical protein
MGLATNLKFNSPVEETTIEIGDYKCSDSGISVNTRLIIKKLP